jgi:hypothetical protein
MHARCTCPRPRGRHVARLRIPDQRLRGAHYERAPGLRAYCQDSFCKTHAKASSDAGLC